MPSESTRKALSTAPQLLSKVLLSQHERNQRQPVQTSPTNHRRNQRQPVQTSPTKHRRNGSPRLWSRAPVLSRSNRKAPRVRWPTARPSETLRRKPQQWMPPKKAKSWSQTLQFENQHGSKPSTTTKRAKVIESYSQWVPAPFEVATECTAKVVSFWLHAIQCRQECCQRRAGCQRQRADGQPLGFQF